MHQVQRFFQEEHALTTVEYGIMLAALTVLVVVAIFALFGNVGNIFQGWANFFGTVNTVITTQ